MSIWVWLALFGVVIALVFNFFVQKGRRESSAEYMLRQIDEQMMLKKRLDTQRLKDDKKYKEVENIVRVSGRFIETANLHPLEIRDASELPYPKERLIHACIKAIEVSWEDPVFQQAVNTTLMAVAQFQEGVGKRLKGEGGQDAEYQRFWTRVEAERDYLDGLAREAQAVDVIGN